MSKHRKGFRHHYFVTFTRVQVIKMKTVMKILRNSQETLSTLEYRINRGVRIIGGGGGLEMVRYNNNRGGWNNRGGGVLEK